MLPVLAHTKCGIMRYLHQVFNKCKAILDILTIYKQASSKSCACSNIKSKIFFKKSFDVLFYLHLQ